jgi:2-C-methyl-D-erythritol 2,4-cyclodiphosphate synthase
VETDLRVGIGRDVHRLLPGGVLILGGVNVADGVHCAAHSDGDCFLHALMDALLGGAALPNIGVLFPNSLAENRGRSSMEMLSCVVKILFGMSWSVINVDAVIQLEKPRLVDSIPSMQRNIADVLKIPITHVGIKATTAEGIGSIGACEAIEAICVCMLQRKIA